MLDIPRYDSSFLMGDVIHIKTGKNFSEIELHWHNYYELIFYFDADVSSFINGNEIRFLNNSVYLLTPFDYHRTINNRSDGSISFLNISFSDTALSKETIAKIKSSLTVNNLSDDDVIVGVAKLISETCKKSKENSVLLTSVLINLICERGNRIYGIDNSLRGDFIKKVYEYIAANFTSHISLADISSHLHLAPAYFSSQFSKVTGYTFISYLTLFRLNYSKELLIHSDKSITQICFESGFSSLSHFFRTFRSYFGTTPSVYRKNHNHK